ncbi:MULTISPECIES: mycofactocin biosynthesis glycosyltransferase MftF [Mycobacterium]|uniref:mycofactocin biosynthesis glycosyltransferase MftF n=1 Tax=Mycobacterium TaxID=1763 RepID=UPI001EEF6D2B|nr:MULTISPECIES: mycofactocin biosynthesis glycosyltransferase MftF [Mycobacterium]BDB40573.1 putative mycofactocin biosynthesis glycosyltransferase MftF [Mycobacterium kiyosense]BDE12388.1 putative mycofactocin biosynthesis glycosyltransferase MftF [Mycobacterium sp. 20KCMC460]GLB88625.1 putative mycofactocin biosynthesis glycosyltransferase MftF [Mycobacterium kiyosense]GLC04451.1 putative mycofactocin biosynthesis glycosyltransferase MftF [Mycobacterium kiyosense]GLC06660.1 putative mycofac
MTQTRLPNGFAVQVDRRVRVLGDGKALLGGSPTRLLRLAPAAQSMLCDGRLQVQDEVSAQLARTLLDATVAHPRPATGPSHRDVTVVIPVRDNVIGVRRLVESLRGLRVIVVDDGSVRPVELDDFAGVYCDVEVLHHPRSRGPAAARNTGLAACTTDFVAFLDSDVAPRRGWLEALLGHFCDPTVALVAPRIVGLMPTENVIARYEAVHSSLDLGLREAPVLPHSTVSYVPSAAIVCRTSAIRGVGGFDETLHSGEDVDLCWRLVEAGARLRYEPIARVAHDHRTELRDWIARKAFYGGSAAPLSVRHPDKTAPVVISGWALMAWILMSLGTGLAQLASIMVALVTGRRIAKAMRSAETSLWDVIVVATRGLWSAALQLASALCRHYWPVALIAAIVSRHFRRVVVVAAVVDGVADWLRRRDAAEDDAEPIGLLTFLLLKRVDDLAYGIGLWYGVLRERNLSALKPQIRT